MVAREIRNWFGDIVSHPAVVVEPETVEEIVAIMRDRERYPAPVRAVGSNHSVTRCGTADGGTLVSMRKFKRILSIGGDTVTAQAGALYIDVAKVLQKRGLQFHANVEIGNVSIGSAACSGTKDSSMPGEHGSVNSYACGVKMVLPSGELIEITEEQPEFLQAVRSSYGLLGIVYEATFKVRPLRSMAVYHETYSLDGFERRLPELVARGESMMMYMSPFLDLITVEYRRYREDGDPAKASRWQWKMRNFLWERFGPLVSYGARRWIPTPRLQYLLIDTFHRLIHYGIEKLVRGDNTIATDQMVRFLPAEATNIKYTFGIWAFAEEGYSPKLREYFAFCREYYERTGYRADLFSVGYRISQDASSLFNFAYDGPVMTFDPVSTGNPGWAEFVVAYNQLASRLGGAPLFNQSDSLTRPQVEKAFGERIHRFRTYLERCDPAGRMLNPYFRELLWDDGGDRTQGPGLRETALIADS